jgi:hypothetical protein
MGLTAKAVNKGGLALLKLKFESSKPKSLRPCAHSCYLRYSVTLCSSKHQ